MSNLKSWGRMPVWWIRQGGLRSLVWRNDDVGRCSAKVAALQIYIAVIVLGDVEDRDDEGEESKVYAARLTYSQLSSATGLSRKLISEGLQVLFKLELLTAETEGRLKTYLLSGFNYKRDWSKVPAKALWCKNAKAILPLREFSMRNKVELYALKMYLYLLSIRMNYNNACMATFEKISERTGIPEKYIPNTYTYLAGVRLLSYIDKSQDDGLPQPNRYYLSGCNELTGR